MAKAKAKKRETFSVCTLNVNGIRSAERKGFSRWLKKHSPDYLCLQELRAWPDQVEQELVAPAGYNSRWVNAQKKGYSGVAVYSKPSVDKYVEGTGLQWGDEEGRVLRADFSDLTVVSAYIPSGSSGEERQSLKYEYMDHFYGYARKLLALKRPVVLCGDVNIAHTDIDIHNPKGNAKNSGFLPEERAWFTTLLEQGWVDVLRAVHPEKPGLYSWWSNRGRAREKDLGWRIDYVLASPDLAKRASNAWIEAKAGLSDHAPVFVEFEK